MGSMPPTLPSFLTINNISFNLHTVINRQGQNKRKEKDGKRERERERGRERERERERD